MALTAKALARFRIVPSLLCGRDLQLMWQNLE